MRAISLDARCCTAGNQDISDMRTPSPSQSSLVSLISSNTSCISPKLNRCLSPLLIPPRTPVGIDSNIGPASPLGALQLDLYTRQEGPIYIKAPDSSTILGRLHLRITYDSHVFDLAVHLIEGNIIHCKKIHTKTTYLGSYKFVHYCFHLSVNIMKMPGVFLTNFHFSPA